MEPAAYQAFTDRLLARLGVEEDLLGLVALGSMSGVPPGADTFSDHDFFVVVRDGAQERFREDPSWLPDPLRIVLHFRETAHGVKALWRDGHLAEFAVFSPDELTVARVNRYRVLLDRADVAARMARVRAESVEQARRGAPEERWSAGQLLTSLVVGVGRWARGERLSGQQLVRAAGLVHLVSLLRATLPPERLAPLDDLDPLRRLERALPREAAALESALRLPAPAAARALVAILHRSRPTLLPDGVAEALEAVLSVAEAGNAPIG